MLCPPPALCLNLNSDAGRRKSHLVDQIRGLLLENLKKRLCTKCIHNGQLCRECLSKLHHQTDTYVNNLLSLSPKQNAESRPLLLKSSMTGLDTGLNIFEALSRACMPWCRYCGSTESREGLWRPGPWGKDTLCRKHGCGYLGFDQSYGWNALDLTRFSKEEKRRTFPILHSYCRTCYLKLSETGLKRCRGCQAGYHEKCVDQDWYYCGDRCKSLKERPCLKYNISKNARIPYLRSACEPLILRLAIPKKRARTIKLRERKAEIVCVPTWKRVETLPKGEYVSWSFEEKHGEYEMMEKRGRILRPSILSTNTSSFQTSIRTSTANSLPTSPPMTPPSETNKV